MPEAVNIPPAGTVMVPLEPLTDIDISTLKPPPDVKTSSSVIEAPGSLQIGGGVAQETHVAPANFASDLKILEQAPYPDETVVADQYRYGVVNPDGRTKQVFSREIQPFYNHPAAIKVVQRAAHGSETNLMPVYTKFILQSVQESHFEKYQIVETFNDFYVFMFGERPPIYNFSGTLINSQNINWVQDFMLLYETFFRGTRCVEANAEVRLTYGGRSIAGYILNVSSQTSAAIEEGVPFSFQMLVTKRSYLGLSLDFNTQISAGTVASQSDMQKRVLDVIAGARGTGTSTIPSSTAINATKDAMGGGNASKVSF